MFEITQCSGIDIKPYSVFPTEEETLLTPNSVFRISSVSKLENGSDHIKMVEIAGTELDKLIVIS